MKVLITGGAGFIGSHLCEYFINKKDNVVCVDNFLSGNKRNIAKISKNENFTFYECDILNREKIFEIFKREEIDLVYHFAALVGVKRTLERPKEVFDVNINGTMNILDASLECGAQKVVNISSSEVYGNPVEVPEKETSPKNVELPYAISKLVGEKYAQIYYEKFGLKTTSLRLFNVYGPRQDSTPYGFVVGIFIKNVLNNQPPVIFGDGFQTRDFTYIDDVKNALVIAGTSDKSNGESFNIAAGKPITILDLAELIIEICDKKLSPVFEPERPFEIRHRFSDVTKMRTVLEYKPKIEIKKGLELTIDWYKNQS